MTTMKIDLPEEMFAQIRERVAKGEAASEAEYVRELIQDRLQEIATDELLTGMPNHIRSREHFERLLVEGFESGPSIPMDDAYFARLRQRLAARNGASDSQL